MADENVGAFWDQCIVWIPCRHRPEEVGPENP